MSGFDHERLDVYGVAIDFVVLAGDVVERFPQGPGYLADQLQRAATSIPLNVAEGAGVYSKAEKARFSRIARRSATECAAVRDVAHRLRLVEDERYQAGRVLLLRVVSMLVKMARPRQPGTGTGTSWPRFSDLRGPAAATSVSGEVPQWSGTTPEGRVGGSGPSAEVDDAPTDPGRAR